MSCFDTLDQAYLAYDPLADIHITDAASATSFRQQIINTIWRGGATFPTRLADTVWSACYTVAQRDAVLAKLAEIAAIINDPV